MHSSLVTSGRLDVDNRMTRTSPTPDAILLTAFGFWNSKILLTAVTFDLFTVLGQGRFTNPEIKRFEVIHLAGPSSAAIACSR